MGAKQGGERGEELRSHGRSPAAGSSGGLSLEKGGGGLWLAPVSLEGQRFSKQSCRVAGPGDPRKDEARGAASVVWQSAFQTETKPRSLPSLNLHRLASLALPVGLQSPLSANLRAGTTEALSPE